MVRYDMVLHQASRARARDVYEKTASAVRRDVVLHRAFRRRYLKHEMQHLTFTGVCMYVYIYIERERDRERERAMYNK